MEPSPLFFLADASNGGYISYDRKWLAGIPNLSPDNNTIRRRLERAHNYSSTRPLANENSQQALTCLAKFGLVIERVSEIDRSSVPLAKYIGDTLLNFSLKNKKPCNHKFLLSLRSSELETGEVDFLQIPARSHLLFLCLAEKLGISIYVFSSRSKSLLFEPVEAAAKCSIGFFYNVDSYFGVGEYLILTNSRDLNPTGIPAAIQNNIYTNPIPVAVFRVDKGKRAAKRKRDPETEELTKDEYKPYFLAACEDVMGRQIGAEAAKAKRRRVPKGTTRESIFKSSGDSLKQKLLSRQRLIKGTMETATEHIKKRFRLEDFAAGNLQNVLGPQKNNISLWKEVVTKSFDRTWNQEVKKGWKGKGKEIASSSRTSSVDREMDLSSQGSSRASTVNQMELDSSSVSSPSQKMDIDEPNLDEADMDVDSDDGGNGGDDDNDDDGDNGDETDDEELENGKKEIRVCTATLKKILRPDFLEVEGNYENFLQIAEEKQKSLTDLMAEMATLSRKVMNVVSKLMFYNVILVFQSLIILTLTDCKWGAVRRS